VISAFYLLLYRFGYGLMNTSKDGKHLIRSPRQHDLTRATIDSPAERPGKLGLDYQIRTCIMNTRRTIRHID